jgi:RNA polymerase sigma factor (sigma-70 family)
MPGRRLSAEEERELVVATERGDQGASRELVDAFLPLIAGVARRFDFGGAVERAELMQEGVAGLLFAARRYDPRMETPFWGYASFWVRKAMQELVADVTRPAALSDHAVRELAKVKAARHRHLQDSGAEPSRAQLVAETGLNGRQIDKLLAIDRTPRSFDEPMRGVDDGATMAFGDTVSDPDAEQQYDQVLDRLEIRAVRDLAGELDERERVVLMAHYGLGGQARTLAEIGSDLGVTAERTRQIERGALDKLRAAAAAPPGSGGEPRLTSTARHLPQGSV